jgi:hypothetical protein
MRGGVTSVDVLVCGAGQAPAAEDLASGTLWYFGADYARYLSLCARAASCGGAVAGQGEAIDAVAARIAPRMIELDAELASGRFGDGWRASDLAERNPYTSSFFLDVCRAIALVEAARTGGRHVVVVDDAPLGRALAAVCRRNGTVARWRGRHGAWKSMVKAGRAHAGFLRGWLRQRRAIRRHAAALQPLARHDVFLMSWTDGREHGRGLSDRFLGELPVWLHATGVDIARLYKAAAWLGRIDEIVASVAASTAAVPSALVGQFLGIRSLLRAYARLLTLPFATRRSWTLNGIDVAPIVRLARRRELGSSRVVAAALYADLAGALARAGAAPRALFYPYENQPWEKVMLAGFRRALPNTVLIGVQHAPLAPRYLSAHPSRRQWSDGTTPDLLLTIGPEFRERLLALGAPPDRIAIGGALRYPEMTRPVAMAHRRDGDKRVLATCSMHFDDSLELAHKAAVATAGLAQVRLAVNFHPMVERQFRDALLARLSGHIDCSHVDFVEGGAAAWLSKADLLLYNSSSTVFEAASAGVPAIHVGSDIALDLDTMLGAETPRCRTAADLRRMVLLLLDDEDHRRTAVERARSHVARCFSVADKSFWVDLAQRTVQRHPAEPSHAAGSAYAPARLVG